MKNIFLVILLFVGAFNISAQVANVASASDLGVLEHKWRFVESSSNLLTDSDPFSANNDQREFSRATAVNTRQNEIRTAQGLPRLPPPTRNTSSQYPQQQMTPGNYLYQIKVKNTGQKPIRSITWNYVFFDNAQNREAGRRSFTSAKKILPGETRKISEKSSIYPTVTIDASNPGKKFEEQYSEQIIISRIEYDDGTTWLP